MIKPLFTFQRHYFLLTVLLFITEILIALFAHDGFVRPYFGDFLVVILLYCFLKSFLNLPVLPIALSVLCFSFFIEMLQYFQIVIRLGLQHSRLARVIIGVSFEWGDLLAYSTGILCTILVEARFSKKPN